MRARTHTGREINVFIRIHLPPSIHPSIRLWYNLFTTRCQHGFCRSTSVRPDIGSNVYMCVYVSSQNCLYGAENYNKNELTRAAYRHVVNNIVNIQTRMRTHTQSEPSDYHVTWLRHRSNLSPLPFVLSLRQTKSERQKASKTKRRHKTSKFTRTSSFPYRNS